MKHFRRRACAKYEEFKIREEDEELIRKNIEEDTTLASRSNQSPIGLGLLVEMMENIKREFGAKAEEIQKKRLGVRVMVLNLLNDSKSGTDKGKKMIKQEVLTPLKSKQSKKGFKIKPKKLNSKSKSMKEAEFFIAPSSLRSNRKNVKGSVLV